MATLDLESRKVRWEGTWSRIVTADVLFDAPPATDDLPNPPPRRVEWEIAERTTRPPGSLVDGVDILAVIEDADGRRYLPLVRQFRAAFNGDPPEPPAGLLDAGESPVAAAARELREETGYRAAEDGAGEPELLLPVSPVLALDPGLSSDNTEIVVLRAAPGAPGPAAPEPDEVISVLRMPLDDTLVDALRAYAASHPTVHISALLWAFALGLRLATRP